MGKAPCCDKNNVKRGPWSPEEDETLRSYIHQHGTGGNWIAFPKKAGLRRCGKSCRLRWLNYLRPDIRHGCFTEEEDIIIYSLYSEMGSRWSVIASQLHGRTDNDVKNHWNTKLKKRLFPKTNHNGNIGENPNLINSTPSQQPYNTLSNIESYDYNLGFSTLQTQDFHAYSTNYGGLRFPQFNANHEVKSEAINGIHDGTLMDFGLGFSNELGSYGFWSLENKGSEFEGDGHSNLGSSLGHSMLYDDEFRPQGLLQSVVNQ